MSWLGCDLSPQATCPNLWVLTGSIVWGGCGVLGDAGGAGGCDSQVGGLSPS